MSFAVEWNNSNKLKFEIFTCLVEATVFAKAIQVGLNTEVNISVIPF